LVVAGDKIAVSSDPKYVLQYATIQKPDDRKMMALMLNYRLRAT
jgi:hypothetical protein